MSACSVIFDPIHSVPSTVKLLNHTESKSNKIKDTSQGLVSSQKTALIESADQPCGQGYLAKRSWPQLFTANKQTLIALDYLNLFLTIG